MQHTYITPRDDVTIIIHTRNEASHIRDCIQSAHLLSTLVIVCDMESNDNTVEYAKDLGAQVITYPYAHIVERARNFAIRQAKTPWIFLLDADERITPEITVEIDALLDRKTTAQYHIPPTHYRVPRKNIFAHKKWLRYGGWWPDYQTRLFLRTSLRDWPERIHATPIIDGTSSLLQKPIEHYFHGDITKMVEKTINFEHIEATLLIAAGRTATSATFIRKYMGELFRRLIKHSGWRDGSLGILESLYQAFSKTITWMLVYEHHALSRLPPVQLDKNIDKQHMKI